MSQTTISNEKITSEMIKEHQKIYSLDDVIKKVYEDSSGKIVIVIHELFPGVHLIFRDVKRESFLSNYLETRRPLIIEHCWRGEMNSTDEKSTMHSSQGDIIIHNIDNQSRMQYYPSGYFKSTSVSFNPDKFTKEFKANLDIMGISIEKIIEKYHLESSFFFIPSEVMKFLRIFEDIHSRPNNTKKIYWKLKIYELLFLLNDYSIADRKSDMKISRAQAIVAQKARQYILEHPFDKITIDKLADLFSVSSTYLKFGFVNLFGVSIKRFDKNHKMQLAAQYLIETDRKIGDIANQFHYINASKFSAAFYSVHGTNPNEYRIAHQKNIGHDICHN